MSWALLSACAVGWVIRPKGRRAASRLGIRRSARPLQQGAGEEPAQDAGEQPPATRLPGRLDNRSQGIVRRHAEIVALEPPPAVSDIGLHPGASVYRPPRTHCYLRLRDPAPPARGQDRGRRALE